MENRQNVLIAILAVVVAAVIAYTVAVTVTSKANTKGLAAIDTISYVMTQESASLSEEELEMRRNKALEDLSAYLEKGGIVRLAQFTEKLPYLSWSCLITILCQNVFVFELQLIS